MNNNFRNTIDDLKKELRKPLPGKAVHLRMIPQDRLLDSLPEITNSRQSSVLLLLFPKDEKLNIVFIRRPSSMRFHAGQIAFPGGAYEPGDEDYKETAIRETTEELGIKGDQIEILGELTPMHVLVSNYIVNAYIGWSNTYPSFNFSRNEVDDIFIIPLENFTRKDIIYYKEVETHLGKKEFPGYFIDGIFIWGATAMILTEFIEIYKRVF